MPNKQSHLNRARLDKFVLAFNLPPILRQLKLDSMAVPSNDLNFEETIQYAVYGVVVPEISIGKEEHAFAGQVTKAAKLSRPSYDDVTVSFNVDNRFANYYTIWEWLDVMNDEKTTIYDDANLMTEPRGRITDKGINAESIPYKNEYAADMSLYGVDEYNKRAVKFTFTEAFPVSLGSITFNQQDGSEIVCSFTFTFSQLHFKKLLVN